MMHQLVDKKKYLIYIFFFLLLTTFNNLNLGKLDIFKIKYIDVIEQNTDVDNLIGKDLVKNLMFFENKNILFVNKDQIRSQVLKNEWILKFSIKKEYPSKLIVNFKKAVPLANIVINDNIFFVGSNFRLIKSHANYVKLPNIFGTPKMSDLSDFFNKIESSKINYDVISNFYYLKSGRWNIKTKNNILIKLPNNETIKSLDLANKILKNKKIIFNNTIDLTVKNQIIVN
jgi:cell division septal protein FtsQ